MAVLTDAAAHVTDRLRFPRHVVNRYVDDREQDAPATVLCDRRCTNVSPLTGLEKGNSTNPGRRLRLSPRRSALGWSVDAFQADVDQPGTRWTDQGHTPATRHLPQASARHFRDVTFAII